MSLLHQPHWQDLSGTPSTGVSPPSLVVRSGRMTPQRHAQIRQIYQRFCMAKLTAVGDFFVFNRVLSDGTRVRLESMQGKDRVFVWASDAQLEDPWDRGWSFIPANDASRGGFLRRPGAASDDLSAAAFMPIGNFVSPAGKAVHTFVDATTGNRRICTDREGGARMWRGGKSAHVLTYDSHAVWVDGVKSALNPKAPAITWIWGAAIAKRGSEQWLVFVGEQRLWAVRLKDLKAQTTACVDCGSVVDDDYVFAPLTRWEFSPDGMQAIALGGFDAPQGEAQSELRGVYRIKLVPENGMVPFRLEVSEQLRESAIKKRVINTFRFNQAKRNFRLLGWQDFAVDAVSTYYGVIRFEIDSGWGPTFTHPGNPAPSLVNPVTGAVENFRRMGEYFDPRMSPYMLTDTGVIFHTRPTNFTSQDITIQIPSGDFLFDDGLGPTEIVYSRTFLPRPSYTPAPPPGQEVGRYFAHLDGWLNENSKTNSYFFSRDNTVWEPYYGAVNLEVIKRRFGEHFAIAAVAHEDRFSTPNFSTLGELISACEGRWSKATAGDNQSISASLNRNYGSLVAKNDYSSYLDFYEYLAVNFPHLVRQQQGGPGFVARQYATLDFADGHTTIFKPGEQLPDEAPSTDMIYADFPWVDEAGVTQNERRLVEMTSETKRIRALAFSLDASARATPVYTLNWTTDWVLESQVFLTGKAYIAASYDPQGQERFLYLEGDDNQRLRYEGSAKASDEPVVQLAWRFSGAMGYRLVLGGEVIDSCTYAVADAVSLPDAARNEGVYEGAENLGGPSPTIRAGQITVHDFDIALGHVLYRKSEEVFSAVGAQSENRQTALRVSYCDFLKTPKAKHQLGEEKLFNSSQRAVDYRFELFADTKALFGKTAPFFTTPNTIAINGAFVNRFADGFGPLVPQAQKNEEGPLSGEVEFRWATHWLTEMMLYMPGVDNEVCPLPEKVFYGYDVVSDAMRKVGRFTKPPQSNLTLRAYSDDCWMVCYQNEMHIQSTSTENTTARYFLKLAINKPVVEFDAANYFPFLGLSKKLLAPKFHIRKKP